MPGAKARAGNGAQHLRELGRRAPADCAFGMRCSAWVNSGLVEGCGVGGGAMPKFGGVVSGTVGGAPRLTRLPSSSALTPAAGASWLPAMSVASARNWYVWPAWPW